MRNIFYVYIYLDPRKPGNYCYGEYTFDYEPFYVGKGCNKRDVQHLQKSCKDSGYFKNKIKKIQRITGTNPVIMRQEDKISNECAVNLETKMIDIIGRYDLGRGPLLNMKDRDEGVIGRIISEQTRKKISNANKGRKHTDENKKKISNSLKGDKNPFYNKHHSEETKMKISESNKGKTLSEETKRKISKQCCGEKNGFYGKKHSDETRRKMSLMAKCRIVSEETRRKMSDARKGEGNGFYGKRHSEETKRKMKEAKIRRRELDK